MSGLYNQYSGRNPGRIQALADGVFAVAMTLLVLDLRLPRTGAGGSHALWSELTDLGPNLAAYLLSFTMLGTFWLAIHTLLDLCEDSDRMLAWAVLTYLFFVTTLPFSASVLADNSHVRLAVFLYWANLAALGACIGWAILHAGRAGLVPAERSDGLVLVRRRLLFAQALYALAALVVILSPVAGIIALAACQLFFVVSPRLPLRA
ncbi:putative membrane protein [Marmoricola sp. URHA0025 HA25]